MAGHVFIVQGDLRKLACDAWLLPCDTRTRPESDWLEHIPGMPSEFDWPPPPEGWRQGVVRAIELAHWPSSAPTPWLVNVGAVEGEKIAWYVAGAAEFLARAGEAAVHHAPRNRRAKPLLALPVVGTGRGGARRVAGDVLRELLPALRAAATHRDVDVVLVTRDAASAAAAQAERGRLDAHDAWPDLDDYLIAEADRLAGHASAGHLVLFLGAGIGQGAGLPLWNGLLEQLAERAGIPPADWPSLAALDPVDRAHIISRRLEGQSLGEATANLLRSFSHHSLSHALLACLPVEEVVTTNYDVLFEDASAAANFPMRVLPNRPRPGDRRWLLKMHGCVTQPESIVLTREDYLRYEERRAALSGIVEALLITRHMLFVGFGLADDNFHRIADAVRRVVHPPMTSETRREPFGTALVLDRNPLQQELWERDLIWAVLAAPHSTTPDLDTTAEAARRLDIFLDCVLAKTRSTSYLLNPYYEALLSDGEKALAHSLRRLRPSLPPQATESPAWARVSALLRSLGADDG